MRFAQNALFRIASFAELTVDGARAPAGLATSAGQTLSQETEEAARAAAVSERLLQHTASLGHGRHEVILVAVDGEAVPYHGPGQCLPLPGRASDLDDAILVSEPNLMAGNPVDARLIKAHHLEPVRVDLPTTGAVLTYLASHPGEPLMTRDQVDEQDGEEFTTTWVAPTVTVPTLLRQYFKEPMSSRQFYQMVWPDVQLAGLAEQAEGLETFFRALAQANPTEPTVPALHTLKPKRVVPCDLHTPFRRAALAAVVHEALGDQGVTLDPTSEAQAGGGAPTRPSTQTYSKSSAHWTAITTS